VFRAGPQTPARDASAEGALQDRLAQAKGRSLPLAQPWAILNRASGAKQAQARTSHFEPVKTNHPYGHGSPGKFLQVEFHSSC
jgi:hypothetical protein